MDYRKRHLCGINSNRMKSNASHRSPREMPSKKWFNGPMKEFYGNSRSTTNKVRSWAAVEILITAILSRYWTRSWCAVLWTCPLGKTSAWFSEYAVDSTVHGDGLCRSRTKSLLDSGTKAGAYQLVSNIFQWENAHFQRNRSYGHDESHGSICQTRFDL